MHCNADKATLSEPAGAPSQSQRTFVWDHLAFDGPFPGRDWTFDALDALTAVTNDGVVVGTANLGQFSKADETANWSVLRVSANPQASAVRVLFNFTKATSPDATKPLPRLVIATNPGREAIAIKQFSF